MCSTGYFLFVGERDTFELVFQFSTLPFSFFSREKRPRYRKLYMRITFGQSVPFFFYVLFIFVYVVHAFCERFYLANSCMTLGHSAFDEEEYIYMDNRHCYNTDIHANTNTEERLSMKTC